LQNIHFSGGKKMKNYLFSPVIAAMVMSLVVTVDAGLIIQDRKNWGLQIQGFSPIGQTFTAEDAQIISIGFWVEDWNPWAGPIDLTVQLFQGVGTGGPSLGSAPIEGLSPGFDGFYDADFTSVSLTVGQVYTAIVSSSSIRGGVWGFQSDVYPGGAMIFQGSVKPYADAAFRVVPIPAPSALMLGGIGLGFIGRLRRRRTL
jgi:hypothetical protein